MNIAECRARLEGTRFHVESFRNRGGKLYMKVGREYFRPCDEIMNIVKERFPGAKLTSVSTYDLNFRLCGDER